MFQLTAARRRLPIRVCIPGASAAVSTHSRPKAAAKEEPRASLAFGGFNSQPPEGGCVPGIHGLPGMGVSTHSRPKAAATAQYYLDNYGLVSTHSRPKAAAWTEERLLVL